MVQGSGIGPVLFLIYIDHLAKLLESNGIIAKLFVDDVKVYAKICKLEDGVFLQQALDLIDVWASEWHLSISVRKCNLVNTGRPTYEQKYYINNIRLPQCETCRDLGVVIDPTCRLPISKLHWTCEMADSFLSSGCGIRNSAGCVDLDQKRMQKDVRMLKMLLMIQ